jgi:two-component system cell cycle sensor histidine kinase/response regulator CckA
MTHKAGQSQDSKALRDKAEQLMLGHSRLRAGWRARDLARVMHELQVHQVELEMQNEELRATQTELADSRDRYRELYDLAPVAYLTLDRSGRIVEANRSAATLLGASRARLEGVPLSRFMREEHADLLHTHLYAVFESGVQQGCEVAVELPGLYDEAPRGVPVHITSIAFGDASAVTRQCRTALIDLSSLRHAQELARTTEARNQSLEGAVQDSETRFRQVADHLQDMLAVIEREPMRLEYVNPAFEAGLGRTFEEMSQDVAAWTSWIHPEDRERVAQAHAAFLAGEPLDEECRLVRGDGEVRWVRTRCFPIEARNGMPARYVSLTQDITARRELEMELRQAQKMEAVGALASGVAHDFNNVLQAVLGCITLAQRPRASAEEARAFLDQAADAARRGGGLSARLMSFAHKRDLAAASTVIDAMILRSATLLERLLTEQISLELLLGADTAAVRADAVQIEQILMNLAANARDAMPSGGRLVIHTATLGRDALPAGMELQEAAQYVQIQVRDFGLGMDEATKARIFEPFFTTKQVGQGTGLGLSTVFSVARQLGGHVDAQSEPNRGATFTILLPCCPPPEVVAGPGPSSEVSHFQGVVLLVEDEAVVRLTVRHHLEELGVEVLEAGDAIEAQRLLRCHSGRIDLLMSDVVLPGMRGTALAERVQHQHPGLRVLFMTANPELLDAEQDGQPTAPILRKPFGRDELVQVLAGLLSEARRAEPAAGAAEPDERAVEARYSDVHALATVVLLVEDDAGQRAALGALLEDRGYKVLSATDANEALELANAHRGAIHLLLTDFALSGMCGEELAQRIRAAHPNVRVVLMSGMPVVPDSRCRFVQKPFDFDTLLELIVHELEQPLFSASNAGGASAAEGSVPPRSQAVR